jgi:hypothetical protein
VLLAPCDVRGTLKGPFVQGTARLTDAAGTERVLSLINAKYGLVSRVMGLLDVAMRSRGKKRDRVGIEIELVDD